MAKVIVWNLVSLDGYFEGTKKWDLDFHNRAWGEELRQLSIDFGQSAGLLVFGRVTYEGMKAHWTTTEEEGEITQYMNALPKLVASRSLTASDWNNTEVTADIVGELKRRRKALDKTICVFGSAELTESLLEAGLVDEIMLCLVPIRLGRGTPFFKDSAKPQTLNFLEARPLKTGAVILRYAPEARTG
ncbi:MAG: dihydrofolate reductase family protein [Alphaproteobacteria bacterium]